MTPEQFKELKELGIDMPRLECVTAKPANGLRTVSFYLYAENEEFIDADPDDATVLACTAMEDWLAKRVSCFAIDWDFKPVSWVAKCMMREIPEGKRMPDCFEETAATKFQALIACCKMVAAVGEKTMTLKIETWYRTLVLAYQMGIVEPIGYRRGKASRGLPGSGVRTEHVDVYVDEAGEFVRFVNIEDANMFRKIET